MESPERQRIKTKAGTEAGTEGEAVEAENHTRRVQMMIRHVKVQRVINVATLIDIVCDAW